MFIPLRTDRAPRRRPLITQAIIIVNLLVYLLGLLGDSFGWFTVENFYEAGRFHPEQFVAWQLVTYQFLHDPTSIWHIVFNMLFLWVFGSAVEGRFKRSGFLTFYLLGGIFAGVGHMLLDPNPVIGASGSVAAVTGAYLALFPRSNIIVVVIFFIIGVYSIPSVWFIGAYFVIDIVRAIGGGGQVAYGAHLAGYIFGFALAFALLALKVIPRTEFDAWFLFMQWRRRAAFRSAAKRSDGAMWDTRAARRDAPPQRQSRARDERSQARPQPQRSSKSSARAEVEDQRRNEISQLVDGHKLEEAMTKYREARRAGYDVRLTERRLLDIANTMYAHDQHADAAELYQQFLKRFPQSRSVPEVRLLLGLVLARHLGKPQRAREMISKAQPALRDPSQRTLAAQLLEELSG